MSKWHAFSLQVKWISELYITFSFNKAFETSRINSENLTDIHYVILEQRFFRLSLSDTKPFPITKKFLTSA